MKTTLSFGLIVAVAGTLLACSDEDKPDRNDGGAGPTAGGGGQTASSGSGGQPSGGSAGQGTGGSGGSTGPAMGRVGDPLAIGVLDNGDASVEDTANNTGIDGAVILAQSTMTVPAVATHQEGKLCMSGTTALVVGDDYATFWGAELSMDLLLAPADGAAPVADAGADAGAPALVRQPWPYGDVIGFSFKVEGQDAAAPRGGLPDAFRFKGLPEGDDPSLVTYCNTLSVVAGATQNILFSDITFECWQTGNPSLADDPIPTIATAGATFTTRPNPRRLQTISWQVNADPMLEHQFNFCVTDLRPILAQ